MKILLVSFDKLESDIEVNADIIAEASMLEFNGRFYVYAGSAKDGFFKPKFVECKAPVKLN